MTDMKMISENEKQRAYRVCSAFDFRCRWHARRFFSARIQSRSCRRVIDSGPRGEIRRKNDRHSPARKINSRTLKNPSAAARFPGRSHPSSPRPSRAQFPAPCVARIAATAATAAAPQRSSPRPTSFRRYRRRGGRHIRTSHRGMNVSYRRAIRHGARARSPVRVPFHRVIVPLPAP